MQIWSFFGGICAQSTEETSASAPEEVTPVVSDEALATPLWKIEADEKVRLAAETEIARKEFEAAQALKAEEEAKAKEAAEAAAKAAAKAKATAKPGAKKKLKAGTPVESKEEADLTKLNYDLEVKIISARGVRDADWALGAGQSDPYCVAEILGKPQQKITTEVINDQKDPVWNATGSLVAAQTDSIQFTVFDKDIGKEDDLLGKVSLPCSKCVPGGWSGEIKMKQTSDTAKAVNAFLKVKVTVLSSAVEGVEEAEAEPKAKAKAKGKAK